MEVSSGQTTGRNSHKSSSTEPTTSQNLNPDVSAISPVSKSRYGRTRKPKISEDFYNIDVIFESARESKKSPRVTPQVSSPPVSKNKSQPNQSPPNKPKINSAPAALKSPKPNPKPKNYTHVTGDTDMTDTTLAPTSDTNEIKSPVNTKTVRKFFKRESTIPKEPENSVEQIKQNTEVDARLVSDALTDESLSPLQAVDVTKVLKIISTKSSDTLENSTDSKGNFKPVLKTYSNKRKSFQKLLGVESFGLPDKPIFPLKNDKASAANEPKRIKNLDVVAPSSENEINIVDKKLLDTPWKIASMNTDFADNEILLETSVEDAQDETKSLIVTNNSEETLEKINDDKIKPNTRTKKVSPKNQLHSTVENLGDSPDKTKILKNKSPRKVKPPEIIIPTKLRSPRKQKQIIREDIEEEVIKTSPVIIKNLRKKSPQKQKQISSEKIVLKTAEDSIKNESSSIVRNKSPRKQKLVEIPDPVESSFEFINLASPENVSASQKRKRSLSLKKTPVNQENSQTNTSPVVVTPQRKSLRLQMEILDNLGKIKSIQSPEVTKKAKKIDEVLPNEKTKVKNENKKLDEMNLKSRSKLSKLEITSKTNNEVKKANFVGRLRERKSKSNTEVEKTDKEIKNDNGYISNDLDDTNLLERVSLLNDSKDDVVIVEEIKTEITIEDESKELEETDQQCVSSTVIQGESKDFEQEKSLYDLQIKSEPEDVELGDLMWAKIGGHPYWPCIISEDPVLKEYKSLRKRIKNVVMLYHVRFFGDRGRRSWVSSSSVMRFNNKNDLSILYDKVKCKSNSLAALQPYIVRASALTRWETAVSEAESLKSSSVQQRFDFFFNMFASNEEKKILQQEKKKSLPQKSEKEELLLELSPVDKQKTKKLNVSGKQTKKSFKTPIKIEDLKTKIENVSTTQTRSKSLPPSAFEPPLENKIKSKTTENLENESETILKLKKGFLRSNLESNSRTSLPLSKIKINKDSRQNSIDEPPDTFLKNPWQVFDIAKRQLNTPEVNSECSFSDTDSHSKSSTNTPIPDTYKEQISRQRRNNLFRGIPRHRVCQVCKKPGEILKCKGPCNGLFHSNCSVRVVSDVIIKEEEVITERTKNEEQKIENNSSNEVPDTNNLEKVTEQSDCKEKELKPPENETDKNNSVEPVNIKPTIEEKVSNNNKSDPGNASDKVEIIHIDCDDSDFEHSLTPKVRLTPSTDFSAFSLAEQIDMKMKEIMQKFEKNTRYADSTTDYTSSEESSSNLLPPAEKPKVIQKKKVLKIKHVTADCVSVVEYSSSEDLIGEGTSSDNTQVINNSQGVSSTANSKVINVPNNECLIENGKEQKIPEELNVADCEVSTDLHHVKEFKCGYCVAEIEPPCSVCSKEVSNKEVSFRQKCSLHMCGKFYHPECLKLWPQTQWSLISTAKHKNSDKLLDTFVCPVHVCHTCASDNPHAAISRCTSDKVVKCLHCPATYHTTNYCVPAGTLILSTSQIVCPRHLGQTVIKKGKVIKFARTINTPWCFICSKGGDLICCETCPTSVHSDCLQINLLEDGTFICEDCETGRFPLYDEIVWVKLGSYRWWPAVILFPNEIPDNVKNISHSKGEFVVKFFGTHDHYWVHRGRVFLFQEGDRGHCSPTRRRVDALFKKSIEEAAAAHHFKKVFKMNKEAEIRTGMKPPPYIRVKVNKPVGNVRLFDGNISNTTSCECDPNQANPCGPDSDCLNRLLLTECDPNICPAKEKCYNQRFEKRQYPPLVPFRTPARGWGLKTLAPIRKGDFVIEYVGEIIDEQEYQRRIHKMHQQKDENYYFLTIDKDRIIDAGPKGNLARFMNHCCQPNCETQKWTVNGDTRVGLFSMEDIPIDSELTFNYNLECIGKEKKICKCGAPNCSGFIGVKAKADESQKKPKKNNSSIKKKKQPLIPQVSKNDGPCFICGQQGEVGACHNKICTKFYHLQCVNLECWPEGKWVCPWHNCDICSKRTIRCCVKCIHSYCPVHSEGNVRYDKLLGFICSEHDPTKESQEILNENLITAKNSKPSGVSTTEETDVTSTTPDEIDSNPSTEVNKNIIDDLDTTDTPEIILGESVTSTPIKNKEIPFTEDCENYITNELEDSNIPEKLDEDESQLPVLGKRKRGRPKRSAGNSPKKIKLSVSNEAVAQLKHNFPTSNLLDIPAQNEVKLSSSVPTRHLRTTRSGVANTELKRFLNRQSELEKDLPIRKRSRPRCEASL